MVGFAWLLGRAATELSFFCFLGRVRGGRGARARGSAANGDETKIYGGASLSTCVEASSTWRLACPRGERGVCLFCCRVHGCLLLHTTFVLRGSALVHCPRQGRKETSTQPPRSKMLGFLCPCAWSRIRRFHTRGFSIGMHILFLVPCRPYIVFFPGCFRVLSLFLSWRRPRYFSGLIDEKAPSAWGRKVSEACRSGLRTGSLNKGSFGRDSDSLGCSYA